jgi:regulator of RNase E activity RraA
MKPEYTNYQYMKYIHKDLKPFLELTTPVVTDAMNRQGAMYGLHHLFEGKQLLGFAFTCRLLHGDWLWVCKAIDSLHEGDVLVVDMGGTESVSCWGDLSNAGLINRHGTGVVVDGGIRDLQDLKVMGVPTYYRAITPNAGNPHEDGGAMQIPVVCGGQVVHPGDVIFGDDSGVVVIPHDHFHAVLEKAIAQEAFEKDTAAKIYAGGPMLSYNR